MSYEPTSGPVGSNNFLIFFFFFFFFFFLGGGGGGGGGGSYPEFLGKAFLSMGSTPVPPSVSAHGTSL